jgi:hypothetical protein
MNTKFEDLMYHAGLTASGCWDKMDQYDRAAVERFAQLIVKECAGIVDNQGAFLRYDTLAVKINQHFGVK